MGHIRQGLNRFQLDNSVATTEGKKSSLHNKILVCLVIGYAICGYTQYARLVDAVLQKQNHFIQEHINFDRQ